MRSCRALLVSAPASGQGKTTATAALARHFRKQGQRVRVFKTGPDFIDPMIHERASGQPVYQLDLWMTGEADCERLLYEAASEADVILVEGVMGLFDGEPSSADLAQHFKLPVMAVIQAGAMAQTFGALALGLAQYRPNLHFHGVLANGVASANHGKMLRESLPEGIAWLGGLPKDPAIALPERHLGLFLASEVADIEARLERAADALQGLALDALPVVEFPQPVANEVPRSLAGTTIAIARDAAFTFIYQANLDLLQAMGAALRFFSPLSDSAVPEADALYLPGGYPELHLPALENNRAMLDALRAFHASGKPIHAECGGMMVLFESITDKAGERGTMAGLLPGHVAMQPRLAGLGLQAVVLPEGELRGHTFHYSRTEAALEPIAFGVPHRHGSTGEAVYRSGGLSASYLHLYFPSNPQAAAALFRP
ncbi:MAG: cobyrinate a,c-diamide synthase [Betaproteobacteria bacterium]|nr:cobyrinate a,c-diamide synthase [Betaproteobacteria bacterium]